MTDTTTLVLSTGSAYVEAPLESALAAIGECPIHGLAMWDISPTTKAWECFDPACRGTDPYEEDVIDYAFTFGIDMGDDVDVATCPGCGSYGRFGSTCVRVIDGDHEECGVRG